MVFHQSMAQTLGIDAIPFTLPFRTRKEKLKYSLPCIALRKMPFFSTSEVQRSFQWLEISSHLTGLNKIQFPDILEWMGNHNPPSSHLHPVPILTRQTNNLGVWFFFLKSTLWLMKILLVFSRFKWWLSSLEELQNGLGRLPSWFEGNWKTAFSKR